MSTSIGMAFFPPNFMLQTPTHHEDHHHPPILPPCSSQDFHGSFLGKRSSMSFSAGIDVCEETNGGEDDMSDDGSQAGGEKKRRLNMEQVKTLEKNFELGNKLEPERKMQLARALGLQPRQIAIWFQNRRARWKTKQLEKDYEVLKRQFDAIKADNDALHAHNQKLHAQIVALKNREVVPTESINLNKETEGSSSNRSSTDNSSEIKQLDMMMISSRARRRTPPPPPIDSPPHNHNHHDQDRPIAASPGMISRALFPSSSSIGMRPTSSVAQLPFQKLDQAAVKEESTFSSMFCGIDDQTGFWPWLEQHQFN